MHQTTTIITSFQLAALYWVLVCSCLQLAVVADILTTSATAFASICKNIKQQFFFAWRLIELKRWILRKDLVSWRNYSPLATRWSTKTRWVAFVCRIIAFSLHLASLADNRFLSNNNNSSLSEQMEVKIVGPIAKTIRLCQLLLFLVCWPKTNYFVRLFAVCRCWLIDLAQMQQHVCCCCCCCCFWRKLLQFGFTYIHCVFCLANAVAIAAATETAIANNQLDCKPHTTIGHVWEIYFLH